MKRVLVATIASLLVAGLIAPGVLAAPATDRGAAVPRVVVVVGPSGGATDRYRAAARAAAALARRYTPDVTEMYSPNATWPAVKKALQGASLVIYLGHGNGWPSKYRDSLYRPTQNGFGLNPTGGAGDSRHQYFGEARIVESIELAKDAVVLLNHLCYASGNTEPGLPEGTLDQARQRVDNFAAGFIAAGASAVVAEAHASPNHMVRSILGGSRSIASVWRTAPTANRNVFGFESVRSPGYIAQMDPDRDTSGFTRSIVLKAGLASADVRNGARGHASTPGGGVVDSAPVIPSLATAGVTLAMPKTNGSTMAGGKIHYKIPFAVAERANLPASVQASVRWDPIDVVDGDTPPETAPAPDASAAPDAPPVEPAADFGLVTAERLGDVVAPTKLKITRTVMAFDVAAPKAPGRYRLTVLLHDAEGVAYDAATQAMVPNLLVRVTGELDAGIDAPTRLDLAPGAAGSVPLWVANLSKAPWGHGRIEDDKDPDGVLAPVAAQLTGTWVALDGLDDAAVQAAADAASVTARSLPAGLRPGAVISTELAVFAPTVAGEYLLVLDIVTPEAGSLTAKGVEPTIIRVTVAPQATSTTPALTIEPALPSPTATDAGGE